MKTAFFALLISICTKSLLAQNDTVVTYYNREGKVCLKKEAIKFSLQMPENDHYKKFIIDGFDNRVESIAYYNDRDCKNFDGPYLELFKNGETEISGYYKDNKMVGAWKKWNEDRKLIDSAFYKDGFIYGLALSWDNEGRIIDSLIFEESGKGISHGYWSNGNRSEVGGYIQGKKSGMWTYYYTSGKKSQEVRYDADSAMAYTCYDEDGNIRKKDCVYEQKASFPGGESEWRHYLERNLHPNIPVDNGAHSGYYTVWVQFIVDTVGHISNIKALTHHGYGMEQEVVRILAKGPDWIPAIQYGRKVIAYKKQPVTFVVQNL